MSALIAIGLSLLDFIGVASIGLLVSLGNGSPRNTGGGGIFRLLPIPQNVVVVGSVAAFCLLFKSGCSVMQSRRQSRVLAQWEQSTTGDWYNRLLSASIDDLATTDSHTLAKAVQLSGRRQSQLLVALLGAAADGSLLVLLGAIILLASPLAFAATFVFYGGVMYTLARVIIPQVSRAASATARGERDLSRSVFDGLSVLREMRVTGTKQYFVGRFYTAAENYTVSIARQQFLFQAPRFLIESSLVVGVLLVGGVSYLTQGGDEAVTTTAIFLAAGARLIPALVRLQTSYASCVEAVGWDALIDDLKAVAGSSTHAPPRSGEPARLSYGGALLELRGASYAYPGAARDAVSNISLILRRGERVAVLGHSGSGKSTLADILAGFREVSSGSMLWREVRSGEAVRVGYVPQSVNIFSGSIADNVSLSGEDTPERALQVEACLRSVGMGPWLDQSGVGLSYNLDSNESLSGGERQRIGIARALYRHSDIIVLDEATSALDLDTEQKVLQVVSSLSREVSFVLVTHRLAALDYVDWVVVMDSGAITSSGLPKTYRAVVDDVSGG